MQQPIIFRVNQALCFPLLDLRSRHGNRQKWRRVVVVSPCDADELKNAQCDEHEPSAEWPAGGPNSDVQWWEEGWREVLAVGVKRKTQKLVSPTYFLPPSGRLAKSQHTQRAHAVTLHRLYRERISNLTRPVSAAAESAPGLWQR